MKEGDYQSKIIKEIEAIDGKAINGNYTKAGEADLQCGWPVDDIAINPKEDIKNGSVILIKKVLLYLAVEVKTEDNYYRVMRAINEVSCS